MEYEDNSDDSDEDASSDDSSDDDEADDILLSPTAEDSPVRKTKSGRSRSTAHGRRREGRERPSSIHSTEGNGVEVVASSSSNVRSSYLKTNATKMLTPDVAFVNGRRLPASVAEYAIAGDLSEQQLDQYEEELLQREREEEAKFRERQKELASKVGGVSVSDGISTDDLVVHPPTRFAYFGF